MITIYCTSSCWSFTSIFQVWFVVFFLFRSWLPTFKLQVIITPCRLTFQPVKSLSVRIWRIFFPMYFSTFSFLITVEIKWTNAKNVVVRGTIKGKKIPASGEYIYIVLDSGNSLNIIQKNLSSRRKKNLRRLPPTKRFHSTENCYDILIITNQTIMYRFENDSRKLSMRH